MSPKYVLCRVPSLLRLVPDTVLSSVSGTHLTLPSAHIPYIEHMPFMHKNDTAGNYTGNGTMIQIGSGTHPQDERPPDIPKNWRQPVRCVYSSRLVQ